jgi:hypothetical protein
MMVVVNRHFYRRSNKSTLTAGSTSWKIALSSEGIKVVCVVWLVRTHTKIKGSSLEIHRPDSA